MTILFHFILWLFAVAFFFAAVGFGVRIVRTFLDMLKENRDRRKSRQCTRPPNGRDL